MALFLKGTLFSVSHLQRKLHKKWISYNGYHPCTHTKGKKILKMKHFIKFLQKKPPIIHLLFVCFWLFVCFLYFLVYNKKAFAQLSDIKDHGRGVPRDHSDTVRSGNHMNIMSGFFHYVLSISIPLLVRRNGSRDWVKHLATHSHELIRLRATGGRGGVGIVPLRHVGVAMVTVDAITWRRRQAVVILLGRGLLWTPTQGLQFHGRAGFFVIRIFTITGAALVRRTMHVWRMRRITAWRRAMIRQVVRGGDVIVLCHVVVWQAHGTWGSVRSGPGWWRTGCTWRHTIRSILLALPLNWWISSSSRQISVELIQIIVCYSLWSQFQIYTAEVYGVWVSSYNINRKQNLEKMNHPF